MKFIYKLLSLSLLLLALVDAARPTLKLHPRQPLLPQ